jgi:Met-zincin
MIKPEILRRIESNGALERIKLAQQTILAQVLSSARFARLVEQEAIEGEKAYHPVDFLADIRNGIWSEARGTGIVKIDAYRRNLQRSYLELMNDKLNGRQPVNDDQRPFIRGELRALNADVSRSLARARDRATRMHLEDVKDQIAKILDPKLAPPAPTTAGTIFRIGTSDEDETSDNVLNCWPDYSIRLPR